MGLSESAMVENDNETLLFDVTSLFLVTIFPPVSSQSNCNISTRGGIIKIRLHRELKFVLTARKTWLRQGKLSWGIRLPQTKKKVRKETYSEWEDKSRNYFPMFCFSRFVFVSVLTFGAVLYLVDDDNAWFCDEKWFKEYALNIEFINLPLIYR